MIFNRTHTLCRLIPLLVASILLSSKAFATVSFVSATNSATLVETIADGGDNVFVFDGIADGQATDLTFATDSTCPGVAMTGGAEFATNWSCNGGVILASVTNRGGMSFGPNPNGNPGTFYITFSDPPTPPGLDSPPSELSGIQLSVFGDVSSWNLSGEASASGATFGVELSGTQGGAAHFRMDLPQAAVSYLGGVLGVFVGGKPDPFATTTTNEDGSVSIDVDIENLKSTGLSSSKVGAKADLVTKKITTGPRSLNIAFSKPTVKKGKSVGIAMCSGANFTSGDKVSVQFTMLGKATQIKKSFTLGSNGCAESSVKLKSGLQTGTLTAKINYKGAKAKGSIKVTK